MLNFDFFNATGACNGTYVRAITSQTTNLNSLAHNIQDTTSFTIHDIVGIVSSLVNEIQHEISDGKAVHIDGLGYFYPKMAGKIVNDAKGKQKLSDARIETLRFMPEKGLKQMFERQKFSKIKEHTNKGRSISVEEALEILQSKATAEMLLNVSDIEQILGFSKAATYRMTRKLVENDCLIHIKHGRGINLYKLQNNF